MVRSGKLMISDEGRLMEREGDEGNCSPVEEVVADGGGGRYGDDCCFIGIGISGTVGVIAVAVGDDNDIPFGDAVDAGLKTPCNRSS